MQPSEKKRIRLEIELLKSINHPYILKLISAWYNKKSEQVIMITELRTGKSLRSYLQFLGRPRRRVIKKWCYNILQALAYLHQMEPYPVVHRDIKCDNMFVCSNSGQICLGDFGYAATMKSEKLSSVVGTHYFMAPEVLNGNYGTAVDIYSFGMSLIEICTLDVPYQECDSLARISRHKMRNVKPLSFYRICDEEIRDLISQCLLPENERPSAQ